MTCSKVCLGHAQQTDREGFFFVRRARCVGMLSPVLLVSVGVVVQWTSQSTLPDPKEMDPILRMSGLRAA